MIGTRTYSFAVGPGQVFHCIEAETLREARELLVEWAVSVGRPDVAMNPELFEPEF